jgi:hypothetical protein
VRSAAAVNAADGARLEARVRAKVTADLALARSWGRGFAALPPALADRKLCEYTRVLQLSALEQRVYARIEAESDEVVPVKRWKKHVAWLTVVIITLYPMCVSRSHPTGLAYSPSPDATVTIRNRIVSLS